MRRVCGLFVTVAGLLFSGHRACADDLQVALRFEYRTVLQFEPLFAFVTLRNRGVRPFVVPAREGQAGIRFRIENNRGEPVGRLYDDAVVREAWIDPGTDHLFMRDLTRWYDLRSTGPYVITALVDWGGRTYHSGRLMVDVVPGISILGAERRVAGLPDRMRTYSLRYWPRAGAEQLFLRVDEPATGMNFGVFLLGPLVRVEQPELSFETTGRVVVLHQSDVATFTRSILLSTPDQVRFIEQQKEKRKIQR